LLFHHGLLAILNVQALGGVADAYALEVVDGSVGRLRVADSRDACCPQHITEGCQAPFGAADEELIGLVGLEGVDEGIPGLDLCCGELPDADRESTKSYFMHFQTCIA
jgi:hypothetical protein